VAGIVQRPGRAVLTMLGTVLGVGAFVAVLGMTATGAGQISHQFTVLQDTTVTVEDNGPANDVAPPDANPPVGFPAIQSPTGLQVGDLILLNNPKGYAVGEITGIAPNGVNTDITFADGDPLNINQSGAANAPLFGPSGTTPSQIRHAYGFDQIQFGSIKGDGTGQTIAIVDAYDAPKITTDLQSFNSTFGLSNYDGKGAYVDGRPAHVVLACDASLTRLGEGYALFTNTLNHPTNSCNAFLAGETTMMGKEHVIETFGVPALTVSMGTSGGAYTSLQVADMFPGLFDGVLVNATFPDALSIALAGEDAHLLTHYFAVTDPNGFTDPQKIAVSGYAGTKAFVDAANQSQRTDPIADRVDVEGYKPAVWNEVMPAALRYDPAANPHGARPTVFDAARNIYGIDPATGFARRPFDNVGVQYGLAALKAGRITAKQFLDLNEKIGGYDRDANYVAARSTGDAGAIARAYQGGVTLGGGGGLASIPVFDNGAYNEAGGYHYQWFHFAIRERIAKQNGNADNHVMWRGPVQAPRAWDVFTQWVASRSKPPEAVDGCWIAAGDKPAHFVAERQTFSREPDSRCNRVYPSFGFTRLVAGGPVDANVLKCQLKKIDPADYSRALTADERRKLEAIFPRGVCDWSKPGVDQAPGIPWGSFGPAPPPGRR
jgi:hypothetical protein